MVDVIESLPGTQSDAEQKVDLGTLTGFASLNTGVATEWNKFTGDIQAISRGVHVGALLAGQASGSVAKNALVAATGQLIAATGEAAVKFPEVKVDLNTEFKRAYHSIMFHNTREKIAGLSIADIFLSSPSGTNLMGKQLGLISASFSAGVLLQANGATGLLELFASGALPVIGVQILSGSTALVFVGGRVRADNSTIRFNAQGQLETVDGGAIEGRPFVIESPSDSEDLTLFKTRVTMGITLQEVEAVLIGSGGPSMVFTLRFGPDRNLSGTEVHVGGFTMTNTTSGQLFTTLTNAAIPSGNFVWVETTDKSGIILELSAVTRYTGKI